MRVKQIDVLRGIAAILVTFFHLTGSSGGLSKTTATYGHYGWTGVQMFFVISGFVLPYSLHRSGYKLKNFGTFLLKRIVRIYPAYLAAIIINVVLTVLTHREVASVITIISHLVFLNSIFGLPGISAVFWTLAIEVQFYLLIGLAYPIVIKNNSTSLVFIIILSFFSIWAKQYTIIYWFPFFALGILIFNKFFMKMSLKVFWTCVGLLIILIIYNYGIPQAIASLFAVVFIVFTKVEKETLLNKTFLNVGAISYSLYLIHWDIGRSAVNVLRGLPIVGDIELLKVFIGMLFSIFFAWLLYLFIEKPSLKLSSKIKYKKTE